MAALELMETAIPRTWNQCQAYINSGTIESDVMPNFIVTFGSPPAGDSTFCTALDSSFCRWDARKLRTRPEKPGMQIEDYERNLRVIRFVKQCDLTPSIPGCLSIACEFLAPAPLRMPSLITFKIISGVPSFPRAAVWGSGLLVSDSPSPAQPSPSPSAHPLWQGKPKQPPNFCLRTCLPSSSTYPSPSLLRSIISSPAHVRAVYALWKRQDPPRSSWRLRSRAAWCGCEIPQLLARGFAVQHASTLYTAHASRQ